MPEIHDLIAELDWRGLIHQTTDDPKRDTLRAHLASPRRVYAGFDPTADSLTIGNLVPIMMLAHVKRAGHTPVVVMGGGTGLIGDPSGKSAERTLMTLDTVRKNVDAQRPIFENVLGQVDGPAHTIANNADWLTPWKFIDFLRDIGKHFPVPVMLSRESVKARLESGLSFTEFAYQILQAYDFLHLYRDQGVTVQFGGSDQFGNIVAGIDLIRRHLVPESVKAANSDMLDAIGTAKSHAFGLTAPLVQKADGGKFGKTETGAVWLTAARTSPYAYHQFWLNASDDDVVKFLKTFTFMTRDEIDALERAVEAEPHKREAQKALANAATTILHGPDECARAEAAGRALFSGDLSGLDERTLTEVFANVPSSAHAKADLGAGADPVALLVSTGLAKSNREAREFLANGSVSANGRKIGPDDRLSPGDLLHGSVIALRRGKKTWHLTRWA